MNPKFPNPVNVQLDFSEWMFILGLLAATTGELTNPIVETLARQVEGR